MTVSAVYLEYLEARKKVPSIRTVNNFPLVRQMLEQNLRNNLANGITKPNVHKVEDKLIELESHKIPVRVYTPEGLGPFPVLLFIHGGAFCLFSLDSHDILCRSFCNRVQCVVVSVDYRLAPEYIWPHGVNDCYDSLLWVEKNSKELNVLPDKIAVAGDSAGGNLATVIAQLSKERSGPKIIHQLLLWPWVDLYNLHTGIYPSMKEHEKGFGLEYDTLIFTSEHYLPKDANTKDPTISPIFGDLRGLPSATVVTAEHDMLRDEGELYAKKLQDAGVPTVLKRIEGVIHGFFFTNVKGLDEGNPIWEENVNFCAEVLRNAFK
eukprot:TRINITY_DN3128_c0_g1_i5.p1 TRINITY_DN3128_c0_g1~~TRINITY_DN3128_c0_g1_i5.p1  ORF type:complete len:321 (-),score=60.61 TRINITY_DN3128_c0_g1_i5:222-1184(-)